MESNRFTFLLNKTLRFVWSVTIFLLPIHFGIRILEHTDHGFYSPFLSSEFTIFEAALLITAVIFLFNNLRSKKHIHTGQNHSFFLLLTFVCLSILSLFLKQNLLASTQFFLALTLLEFLLFYILIVNRILRREELIRVFLYSLCLQSVLAFFQVLLQWQANDLHIARFSFLDFTLVRAYGTFPHPNILGGFMSLGILLTLLLKEKYSSEKILLISVLSLGLFMSFSRSAILALLLSLFILGIFYRKSFFKWKQRRLLTASILLLVLAGAFVFRSTSLWQGDGTWNARLGAYKTVLSQLSSFPLGEGFTRYTASMDDWYPLALAPWDYQPVHNLFFLLWVEWGYLLLIPFLFLFLTFFFYQQRLIKKKGVAERFRNRLFVLMGLSLFVIANFDHYLLTLSQGRFLLLLIVGLSSLYALESLGHRNFKKAERSSKNSFVPE